MNMNKSYVSLETKICPATGKTFQTDSILLDTRMKQSMDRKIVTGYQFSPEVQEQLDKGFVVLVECDPEKSVGDTPDTVWRTGNIAYLKKDIAQEMFNKEIITMAYIEPDVFAWLQKIQVK